MSDSLATLRSPAEKTTPPRSPTAVAETSAAARLAEASGPAGNNIIWKICKGVVRAACTLCFDLKVYDTKHVPTKGGVLLVGNHQSFVDPIANCVLLRRPTSFLAKAELFKHPFFNFLFRQLHGIPVRQGEGDIAALRETIARLKEGYVLMLFPEGSRSENGEIGAIEPGVGLIGRKAGVPIVPVVIAGAFEALPRGAKMVKLTPVRVQFGPPINIDGLKASQIVEKIDQTLRQMFNDLRARLQAEIQAKRFK